MDEKVEKRYKARAKIIKALAHPSRLFIVDELEKGKKCVCELTEMIGDDISTVSKHLSLLNEVGLISKEKQGNKVFYTLETPCILKFLGCVERVIKNNIEKQMELIE